MKKLSKLDIIQETVDFYSILENRSIEGRSCKYNGPNGKHCAFARCVENPQDLMEGQIATVLEVFGRAKFKPEYAGFDTKFWYDVQQIHDRSDNWDHERGRGLSENGREYVATLQARYANQ